MKTSYGGRFVVAIDGVASAPRRDWFYFVDGMPPSRSAVEVRLHDGDVVWWDYRSWRKPNEVPAVVGAFPQPFLRGPAVVVGTGSLAAKLARLVHGRVARARRGRVRARASRRRRLPRARRAPLRDRPARRRGSPRIRRVPVPLRGRAVSAVPAAALLAALALAALLADSIWVVGAIAVACSCRACARRAAPAALPRRASAFSAGMVFVLSPWLENTGSHPFWPGPIVPVLGELTVTREELAPRRAYALRFAAVGLAFAAYALLLDHDRLLGAAAWARRSALAVALATRLVPTLERDAVGSRRGAARPRRRGRGRTRARAAALAAARGLARARAEPRRGDGGARLRPARAHARADAAVDAASTGSRSRPRR